MDIARWRRCSTSRTGWPAGSAGFRTTSSSRSAASAGRARRHGLAGEGDRVGVLRVRHVEDEALDAGVQERLDLLADLVGVAHGQHVLQPLRIDRSGGPARPRTSPRRPPASARCTTVAIRVLVISAGSRPTSSQWPSSTPSRCLTRSTSPNRFEPSAYLATNRSVLRSPLPPIRIGMSPRIGFGLLNAPSTRKCLPCDRGDVLREHRAGRSAARPRGARSAPSAAGTRSRRPCAPPRTRPAPMPRHGAAAGDDVQRRDDLGHAAPGCGRSRRRRAGRGDRLRARGEGGEHRVALEHLVLRRADAGSGGGGPSRDRAEAGCLGGRRSRRVSRTAPQAGTPSSKLGS